MFEKIRNVLSAQKLSQQVEQLTQENAAIKQQLLPEHLDILQLRKEISQLAAQRDIMVQEHQVYLSNVNAERNQLQGQIQGLYNQINGMNNEIRAKQMQVASLDDDIFMQEFGVHQPIFRLSSSEAYRQRIDNVIARQKDMIKSGRATRINPNWTVNGSLKEGKKMNDNNVKQILRSFNNECDVMIDKVRFNNFDAIRARIEKAFHELNKMNQVNEVSILPQYLNLKMEELALCFEYEQIKQREKEEQARERERLREERKVLKEIEAMKAKIIKEETHFRQALESYRSQLNSATSDALRAQIETKIHEMELQLERVEKDKLNVLNREANTRAGYVYIISNIGAFGENVYKIGVTRRLEPNDRILELGDASVPFRFDTHALIFSEDAPKLEHALHQHFENRRLNKINGRREFFRVTLEEIEAVVKAHHNKVVEFKRTPDAEEYRESQKLTVPIAEAVSGFDDEADDLSAES
jgi:hypothetical protein